MSLPSMDTSPWSSQIQAVAQRYDREFSGQAFQLPQR
jgi:hypothetical protein